MKGRILAIDDELHMLKLLERVFAERTHHQLETTNNSLEVVSILQQKRFDVIITDLKMPGIGGMEILKWVTEQGRDEQVIIITAFGSVENAREAVALGAFDYINKPFKQEVLLFAVDRALHFAALQREYRQATGLFSIKPFDQAAQAFGSAYIQRLAAQLDGDRQAVAEQSGLSMEEVNRALGEVQDDKL